jgi:cytochrome c oxidase subunit 3
MPADNAGSLALLLALIGIATLFTVLIAVWLFLRRPAPDWRASAGGGALDALWLSSACLFLSSAAVECAARRARMGFDARRIVRRWLSASVLLGAAFVAAQIHLWTVLWHGGLVPSTSGYAAVFFAVTGLHGLHVLGGLAFLSHLTLRHSRAAVRAVRASSVRLGAVYWHFMGALWLVLFTLLYFVR